jgi:hypothetical protein
MNASADAILCKRASRFVQGWERKMQRFRSTRSIWSYAIVLAIWLLPSIGWSQSAGAPTARDDRSQTAVPTNLTADAAATSLKDWATILAPLVTLVAIICTYIAARRGIVSTGRQKANEAELKVIDEKLNTLYGPLIHILARDHTFAQDLRERQRKVDPNYRMLSSLFKQGWKDGLSPGDRALVEEVCQAANELDELILKNLGMVDAEVRKYFVRAAAHFRILRLANNGSLGHELAEFEKYVYPIPFSFIVRLEVDRLLARKDQLLRNFSGNNQHMPKITIDPNDERYKLDRWPDPDGRLTALLGLRADEVR